MKKNINYTNIASIVNIITDILNILTQSLCEMIRSNNNTIPFSNLVINNFDTFN